MTMAQDPRKAADSQQEEVDRNYEAFQAMLPELIKTDANRTALMRGRKVIACFDTSQDAIRAGRAMFEDGVFSIQEVTKRSINLGYFSHAGLVGRV